MKNKILLAALLISVTMNAQVMLDSGLVACYPFSGSADDLSGHGHNGTVVGATLTADRFGNPNSAYLFTNKPNCYITISRFDSLLTSNEISISFWCQPNSNTSNQPFLAVPDAQANRFGFAADYTSIGVIWDYGNITIPAGRMMYSMSYSAAWQHYVFLVSKSKNEKRIFLNGMLVDSSAYGMAYNPAGTSLYIGGADAWNRGWLGFSGAIDDIRIYNRPLNDSEVVALYKAPATGIACAPQGVNDIEGSAPYMYSPAAGTVHMDFGKASFKGTLQVFNILGQKIEQQNLNVAANTSYIYALKNAANGVYILVLTNGVDRYSYKFML